MTAKEATPVTDEITQAAPVWWRVTASGAAVLGLVVLALLVVLPYMPVISPMSGVASGSFLQGGAEILRGKIIYRDFWAQYPPLAYFLDALGLAVGGTGGWGVWVLGFAAVSATAVVLFFFLKRYFGQAAAGFAAAGLLANLVFVYERGNLPEVFNLPLQAGVLLLLAETLSQQRTGWRPLFMGLLVGLAASLKLSLIGTGLAAVLILLAAAFSRRSRKFLVDIACMGAGFLLVWAVWMAYLAANHALPAFWDQAFRYTLLFSGATNLERLQSVQNIFLTLYPAAGFYALALLAWLVIIPFLTLNEPRFREALFSRGMGAFLLAAGLLLGFNGIWDDRTRQIFVFVELSRYRMALLAGGLLVSLLGCLFLSEMGRRWGEALFRRYAPGQFTGLQVPLAFALLDLPVELVLASSSGSMHVSSYLPVLTALALSIAFLAWSMLSRQGSRAFAITWLGVLALPVLFTGLATSADVQPASGAEQVRQAAAVVQNQARPSSTLLQWGGEERLYFLSGKPPASRYASLMPLFAPGYASAEKIQGFLAELAANPPAVVVDTRAETMPLVIPGQGDCARLDIEGYMAQAVRAERDARFPMQQDQPLPYIPPEMKAVYRWLCENYVPVSQSPADLDAWRWYRLRGQP